MYNSDLLSAWICCEGKSEYLNIGAVQVLFYEANENSRVEQLNQRLMEGTLAEPRVSIIVVSWNGQRYLEKCLRSLCRQTYLHKEIIFVDNGSVDSSVRFVQEQFPEIKIVSLLENRGFSGGNVEGFELATGEFIALVNNDACAEESWLESLLQPLTRESKIGICASKVVFDNGEINNAGQGITTASVGLDRGLGRTSGCFILPEAVFGAGGAAVLYRRKMLDEIGFLDDAFFLYDEDTDLNFRAQLSGWKCVYVPTAIVHHVGNATARRLSDTHVYYHTRNLEFVWIKNMPLGLMLRFAHHKIIQEIGSFCYLCLRHGRWRAFFRAKRDALKLLPVMLRKRKEIQSRRRVSNKYIRGLMTSMFSMVMIRQKFVQFIKG